MSQQVQGCLTCKGMIAMSFLKLKHVANNGWIIEVSNVMERD
jgi:hypothetical protein